MNVLVKGQYQLLPLERREVPADVLALVEKKGTIAEMKRFRARNWRRKEHTGFAFDVTDGTVMVIQEGCESTVGRKVVPAWGVSVVDSKTGIAAAVKGLFCHTAIEVSLFGYNVAIES